MNIELQKTGIVEKTKEMLHAAQGTLIAVSVNLSQIKSSGEWEKYDESWGNFCESTLGISQSQASKLLSIHQHFILEGGMQPEELVGVDYEKLNMARSLPGSIEEQFAKAKTLSRRDLKEEKNEEVPHEHIPVAICKICSIRIHEANCA